VKRGDAVLVRRYARPGKPRATDVPTVVYGSVIKAVSGVVWVDVNGDVVRAWRSQVQKVSNERPTIELLA
jgi:hypothetical protein